MIRGGHRRRCRQRAALGALFGPWMLGILPHRRSIPSRRPSMPSALCPVYVPSLLLPLLLLPLLLLPLLLLLSRVPKPELKPAVEPVQSSQQCPLEPVRGFSPSFPMR